MAYPAYAMQIRPGVSLLQAISRAAEPRPVPFAERLAEIKGGGPGPVQPQASPTPAGVEAARAPAGAPPDAAPPVQQIASRQGVAPRPRGSLVDIVV
jgi:hypothetical protein